MDGAGEVVGINHIGISVADLDVARRFWEALGFTTVAGWDWGPGTTPADEALGLRGTAAEVAILAAAASYLELFAFGSPPPATRAADAPGIAEVTVAVDHVARTVGALAAAGFDAGTDRATCPDGTAVRLVDGGAAGLRRVVVRVADPASHPLLSATRRALDDTVELVAEPGGHGPSARPCDLGANHVCLDVHGIAAVRAALGTGVRWNHDVTSSSGGIASVCYGTTADGVLVELLENHSPDATLSRARFAPR